MQSMKRLILSALALALATVVCGACGNRDGSEGKPETSGHSGASAGGAPQGCLTAAEVSSAVGLEVRELPEGTRTSGGNVVCAYQATDDKLGAFVTVAIGPAEQSDQVFGDMRESAKLALGADAEPEAIQVGERGRAYGSMSKSEATAVSGRRLYHAEIVSSASTNIGDKKAGMIEIVKKLASR